MIQIITGDKGKGKTKVLIDKVNNERNERKTGSYGQPL